MSAGGSGSANSNINPMPWGIDSTELQPASLSQISDNKLAKFAVGQQKKSRFQKAREERELKKKQEEEETAKVYDSFVESFTQNDDSKTFVRGGKVQANSNDVVLGGRSGDVYKLEKKSGGGSSNGGSGSGKSGSGGSSMTEMERMLEEMKERDAERARKNSIYGGGNGGGGEPTSSSSTSSSGRGGVGGRPAGGRQIDDFFNEIKTRHEEEGTVIAGGVVVPPLVVLDRGGSFDTGDQSTTNLYIGNLEPSITEENLFELFSKFGEINSIKVMWPRTDEERARKRNCGFVSFRRRSDAEDAKMELNDYSLEGYKMIVGWGKAVKINSAPFVLPPSGGGSVQPESLGANGAPPPPPPVAAVLPPPPPPAGPPPPAAPAIVVAPLASATVSVGVVGVVALPIPPPPPHDPAASVLAAADVDVTMPSSGGGGGLSDSSIRTSLSSSSSASVPAAAEVASTTVSSLPTTVPATPVLPAGAPAAVAVSKAAEMGEDDVQLLVEVPDDSRVKDIIDLVAKFVAADGESFEKTIKIREDGNPLFAFLFNPLLPEALYYRWRTYANILGDKEKQWRTKPYQLIVNGPFFVPPAIPPRSPSYSRSRSRSRSRGGGGGGGSTRRERRRSRTRSRDRGRGRSRDRDRSRDRGGERRGGRSHSRSRDRGGGSNNNNSSSNNKDHRDTNRDRDRDNRGRSRDRDLAEERKKYAGMTGAQIERAKAQERGKVAGFTPLKDREYDEFEGILQGLTVSRGRIKEAMGFAFDHVESAKEIADLILESLLVRSTPVPIKIARLYLVSDILHNSAAPIKHASQYRNYLHPGLPEVFESFGSLYRNASGRMTAKQLEERVMGLLSVWEDWSLFPLTFLTGLEAAFLQSDADLAIYAEQVEKYRLQGSSTRLQDNSTGSGAGSDGITTTTTAAASGSNNSNSSEGDATSDLDALKRRAKLLGVAFNESSSSASTSTSLLLSYELRAKIDYVERFAELKKSGFTRAASAAGVITAPVTDPSEGFTIKTSVLGGAAAYSSSSCSSNTSTGFSIGPGGSGIVGRQVSSSSSSAADALYHGAGTVSRRSRDDDNDNDDDVDGAPIDDRYDYYNRYAPADDTAAAYDDDDVDGVPIGAGATSSSGSKPSYATTAYDDDDVDGVPLGGAPAAVPHYQQSNGNSSGSNNPLYDDDVDGVPLDPLLLSSSVSQTQSRSKGAKRKRSSNDSDSSDDDEEEEESGPGRIEFY